MVLYKNSKEAVKRRHESVTNQSCVVVLPIAEFTNSKSNSKRLHIGHA